MAVGDKVKVKTSDEEFVGILMPDSVNNKLVLKLDSGYNVGIDKKKVKNIKVLEKSKVKKSSSKKIKQNPKLSNIAILHTGGTIASKIDYETGGVTAKFTPEEILDKIPELGKIANLRCKLVSNVFSEDLTFKNYNILAKEIEKEVKKGVKGIIITHGTDTMHYSSAALSFMLENLSIPVVFVGAQRSSDRGSTDAGLNLICAAQFIVKVNYPGVCICMHKSMEDSSCLILPGVKARKLHSSRRDAFKVVNDNFILEIDKNGKILSGKSKFDSTKGEFKINLIKEGLKMGILRSHPQMNTKEISCFKGFDGLILEGTGLGHFPIHEDNKGIFKELKKLSKEMPLVMTSQTIFGRVNMNVYSTGRELQEFVIPGEDMLTEVAFVKLAYLLSNSKKDVKALMREDLKGEINSRISDEFI
jgi:glutamyl-tRNA(Gln) amidotransferase subunit D